MKELNQKFMDEQLKNLPVFLDKNLNLSLKLGKFLIIIPEHSQSQ